MSSHHPNLPSCSVRLCLTSSTRVALLSAFVRVLVFAVSCLCAFVVHSCNAIFPDPLLSHLSLIALLAFPSPFFLCLTALLSPGFDLSVLNLVPCGLLVPNCSRRVSQSSSRPWHIHMVLSHVSSSTWNSCNFTSDSLKLSFLNPLLLQRS